MLKYMHPYEAGYTPKVLLLGNGINRAFDGVEWDGLLKDMAGEQVSETDWDVLKRLPYPLMAVAATEDQISHKMKEQAAKMVQVDTSDAQKDILKQVLNCKFDAILTTNYTYEIEKTLIPEFKVNIGKTSKYRHKTCKDVPKEEMMRLYQYFAVENEDTFLPIWHIHGEAAKPDTMVIGHYYYGKLLSLIQKYSGGAIQRYKMHEKTGELFFPRSWVDYFFSEMYM